jgi:hypothetical protein
MSFSFSRQGQVPSRNRAIFLGDTTKSSITRRTVKTLLIVTVAAIFGASLVAAMMLQFESSQATPLAADAHWINAVTIIAPDSARADQFGSNVALDGDLALIGAPENDRAGVNSGAVYVVRKGRNPIRLGSNDTRGRDEFGRAVALCGQMALVGKPGDSVIGEDAGAAYLCQIDEQGNSKQVCRLVADDASASDRFGDSVALDAETVLVGTHNERDTGAVYVFQGDSHGTWRQRGKLVPDIETPGEHFGCQISVRGNLAVIGASGLKDNSGAAYLFERDSAGSWQQLARLIPSDGISGRFFDVAVAIWDRTILMGAPRCGCVFLFQEKEPRKWQQVAKLVPKGATTSFYFGKSIAMNEDTIAVGSPYENGTDGAIYLFRTSGDGTWQQTSRIVLPEQSANAWFGHSLSISGNELLVGAPYGKGNTPKSGAAYLFRLKEERR